MCLKSSAGTVDRWRGMLYVDFLCVTNVLKPAAFFHRFHYSRKSLDIDVVLFNFVVYFIISFSYPGHTHTEKGFRICHLSWERIHQSSATTRERKELLGCQVVRPHLSEESLCHNTIFALSKQHFYNNDTGLNWYACLKRWVRSARWPFVKAHIFPSLWPRFKLLNL